VRVVFFLQDYIEMHGHRNIKKKKPVHSLAVARQSVNLAGPQWVAMQTGRRGTFYSALHLMTRFGQRTQI